MSVRIRIRCFTAVFGALALIASLGLTQWNTEVPQLNQQLLQLLEQISAATPEQAVGLRNQAAGVIRARAAAFAALIAQSPRQALNLAFSQEVLAQLGSAVPASAAQLESRGIWQGELEYLIEDGETMTTSRTHLRLRVAQEVLQLHLAGPEPPGLKSGVQLQVQGLRAGNAVAVETAAVVDPSVPAVCSTLGAQPVVAILVNLQSFTLAAGITQDLVRGILLGNAFAPTSQSTPDRSVDDFWRQNSDGLASVDSGVSTVVGPYTLSSDFNAGGNCDPDGLRTAALSAADAAVNFQNYSRVMIVFPPNSACTFAGLGTIGCGTYSSPGDGSFTASVAWNRSDQMSNRTSGVQLITHEGGHNLGLGHASSRDFGAETLGPVGTPGTHNEYGDVFSTMGAWNFGFYSAAHAVDRLNWLTLNTHYQVVESSGTFTIQNYETRPAGMKALKVRRGTGNDAWLWIEYRQNTGLYDSQLNSQVWSGVLIHHKDSTTGSLYTNLPDFFQPALDNWTDVALPAGSSWNDPYSDVSISVSNATTASVDVTVSYVPNDNFSNAVPISSTPFTHSGNTAAFTTEADDPFPSCGNSSRAKSAWYRFTAPQTGTYVVDTLESGYDTILSAYTGAPGSFSPVACNDDSPSASLTLTFDELSFQPVDGLTFQGVTFSFSLGGMPSTDANYGSGGPGTITYVQDPSLEGNAAGILTLDFGVPTPVLQFGVARNTVSSLTPGFTVQLFDASLMSLGTTPVNTTLPAGFSEGQFNYSGTPVKRAVISFNNPELAGRFAFDNLLYDSGPSMQSQLSFLGTQGVSYSLMVSAPSDDGGPLTFHASFPTNDNFSDAISMTGSPFTQTVNTSGFTTEGTDPVPACGNGSTGKSAWFHFTPSTNGTATVDTFTSNYDTILSAFTGAPGMFSQVACNDDFGGLQSQITFSVTAGVPYFLMVTDWNGTGGSLTVHATFPADAVKRRRSQLTSE